MGQGRSENRVTLVAGVACTGEVGEAEDAVGDLTLGLYLDCEYSSVVERGDEGGSVGVGGIDIRMVRNFKIQGQQFSSVLQVNGLIQHFQGVHIVDLKQLVRYSTVSHDDEM